MPRGPRVSEGVVVWAKAAAVLRGPPQLKPLKGQGNFLDESDGEAPEDSMLLRVHARLEVSGSPRSARGRLAPKPRTAAHTSGLARTSADARGRG